MLYTVKHTDSGTTYTLVPRDERVGMGRDERYIIANLYYLNKVYGLYSPAVMSYEVSGRPFRMFIHPKELLEQTDAFWLSRVVSPEIYKYYENGAGSVVQFLGDSYEIQYCAAALGIPYDIVGVVEMLILAIV